MKSEKLPVDRLPDHFQQLWSRKVRQQIDSGVDIIRFDVGSPDLPPPDIVIDRLRQSSLDPGNHGYQPILGPGALREAWAAMYTTTYSVSPDPTSEVLPLLGSKEGIYLLSAAILNPDDIVLIPDLAYPTYEAAARFAGARVTQVPLVLSNDSCLELETIPPDILNRARLLWINFPNNPTGVTVGLHHLRHCLEFCREHEILLCHDAAYTQVTYDIFPAPSLLQISSPGEAVLEFNSLSKSHNMAGWRAGAVIGQAEILKAIARLIPNLNSGAFGPINDAVITALQIGEDWIQNRNEIYKRRRDTLLNGLRAMGFKTSTPEAGLYIWAETPDDWDSLSFTTAALTQAGVSLIPGTAFGQSGERWFRISLTAPEHRIEIGMERLENWLSRSAP